MSVMVTPSSVAHVRAGWPDIWWRNMLIADSDMFPALAAASQAVICLLVHFKKKKFMVSIDKRLDNLSAYG